MRSRTSIATTTLTFTGLTVACARCHNHKFDPIPQKDYYRIQSVFYLDATVGSSAGPAHEVEAHRAGDGAASTACSVRCAHAKRTLEAPYLKQLVDREIALLPEYLQAAWKTPAAERTEGQRLNVAQIERTLQMDSLRAKITEKTLSR